MGISLKCYKASAEFIPDRDPSGKALRGLLHLQGWSKLKKGFLRWVPPLPEPDFEAQYNIYSFGLVIKHLLKRFLES